MENPLKRLFGGKNNESLEDATIGESAEIGSKMADAELQAQSLEEPRRKKELSEKFEESWNAVVDKFIDNLPADDRSKSSFRGDLEEYKDKILLELLNSSGATKHNAEDLILRAIQDELKRFEEKEQKMAA